MTPERKIIKLKIDLSERDSIIVELKKQIEVLKEKIIELLAEIKT